MSGPVPYVGGHPEMPLHPFEDAGDGTCSACIRAARYLGPSADGVCSYCRLGLHADCADFDCRCDAKPDAGHSNITAAPDPADLADWLQEWAESQPAITIRRGVEPQVAWRALADELLRRWGR